jgi:DNA-binding XRE family transcriptional regulator
MDSAFLRQHVGGLIRARRKILEMTQEELATRMGMSRAALANVETGRQNILLPQLYRFAEALGLKVTDLLPDPATLRPTPAAENLPMPGDLSPVQRAQVARLLGDGAGKSQPGGERREPGKATRSAKEGPRTS